MNPDPNYTGTTTSRSAAPSCARSLRPRRRARSCRRARTSRGSAPTRRALILLRPSELVLLFRNPTAQTLTLTSFQCLVLHSHVLSGMCALSFTLNYFPELLTHPDPLTELLKTLHLDLDHLTHFPSPSYRSSPCSIRDRCTAGRSSAGCTRPGTSCARLPATATR